MQHHIDNKIYHIEILTPKQNTENLEEELGKFSEKYQKVMEAGYVACITDNPMGHLSFQTTDIVPELGLPVYPEQLMIHLNTFHTKPDLDGILNTAQKMGAKYLLVISGDGSERLPKLSPESIGANVNAVTSVELLKYIKKTYPGVFRCGVAFNPYEPQDHELEKMHRKVDAGAEFIITQPVIGRDDRVYSLKPFGLPVIIDAWMSKKLHLLSECVGYTIPEDTPYDPIQNLRDLRGNYPECGLYLALVGYKTQFPQLKDIWT
jgi:methylenetetrahydrofolate reductase (NADPH)